VSGRFRFAGLRRNVVALGAVSLLNDAGSEMVIPFLGVFLVTTLGTGATVLGIVEGLADAISSILKVLAGRWSDRAGRTWPFVFVGYAMAAGARPFLALATAPIHVVAVRVTDRIGKGLRTAPRDALLAASVPKEERGTAFGIHRSMDHAGAIVGPLLALGVLLWWTDDLRILFACSLVPGLLSVLTVLLFVREAPTEERVVAEPAAGGSTPYPWRLLVPVAISTLGTVGDTFLMLKAGVTEATPLVGLPLLWIALHLVRFAIAAPGGWLADRIGALPIVVVGWTWRAMCLALLAVAEGPLATGVAIVGLGLASVSEAGEKELVARHVGADRRGTAFGGYHGVVGLMALPGAVGFGLLWDHTTASFAFAIAAALSSIGAVELMTLLGRRR
jgi:predicted MFS family arabinose efflux permease